VQNDILTTNPAADLDVYVVWFNMYPGDARWRWDGDGMTDSRVTHLWDEQKTVGTWFSQNLTHQKSPTWDFYALYAPDALNLSSPSSMGGSIIGSHTDLATALRPLLGTAIQADST
jgi:hypothetical protein